MLDATCTTSAAIDFGDPDILARLEVAGDQEVDALPFGVVAMSHDGTVVAYNRTESGAAGLSPGRVLGRHFFTAVAPCTNNHLVAHRFAMEPHLDDVIPYTFTFRMAPKAVRLRMLRHPDARRMYLLVKWA